MPFIRVNRPHSIVVYNQLTGMYRVMSPFPDQYIALEYVRNYLRLEWLDDRYEITVVENESPYS